MHLIEFENSSCHNHADESVLECLERHGHGIPNSCRSGVCQSCLLRAVEGVVPARSQSGLKPTLSAQGYFMACMAKPEGFMRVCRPEAGGLQCAGHIESIAPLNDLIARVQIRTAVPLIFEAGQFMNLVRGAVIRSYSIASLPDTKGLLDFHVGRIANGAMSVWLHDEAKPGDPIGLRGPQGNCFYVSGQPDQPLLLAGTGTGLAPLYGILRAALAAGHAGELHLLHGALDVNGLYLVDELRRLEREYKNVHYYPSVLRAIGSSKAEATPIDALIDKVLPNLKGYRVYLAGHPDLVKMLQRKTFMAGAKMSDIYADAFLPAQPRK